MSDSSDELELLAKIQTRQICRLLSTLSGMQMRTTSYVQKAYSESAANFQETVGFLSRIGWVSQHGDALDLTAAGANAAKLVSDDAAIRASVLETLMRLPTPYRPAIASYLRLFKFSGETLSYRPSLAQRSEERPIRDLLMDLRSVSYDPSDGCYVLEASAAPLYIWATNFGLPKSTAALASQQRRREEIGFAAELVVLDYERLRLGDRGRDVEHVSAEQPFACYDIKSFTITSEGAKERFIEVKAVSHASLEFYWSRAEMDAARLLRDNYFLYLLPYKLGGGFAVEALKIICDPHRELHEDQTWEVTEDVVHFRKKKPGTTFSAD